MGKAYVYVTGGKGGIGKTTAALAIVDYFAQSGKVLLIDADPINADSSAAYKEGKDAAVTSVRARVRSEDSSGQIDSSGLMETLNEAAESDADAIIVDAPAGDSVLLANAGSTVTAACQEMGVKSVFVWLVDANDRTPVNALASAWEAIKNADLILLFKNYKKGTNFDFFDNAKAMSTILDAPNVRVINMPKIAERLVEHLRIDRMTWAELATKTQIGTRMEGQRLRKLLNETFKEAGL
jgi:NAD(P)-dependent dehydrogenase (short-subunit alcohol dehydrogenase family)